MNKQVRWYWTGTPRGWVHGGPCYLAGTLEGWTLGRCSHDAEYGDFWEPGTGGHKAENEKSGTVCLVCKRWEPPSE